MDKKLFNALCESVNNNEADASGIINTIYRTIPPSRIALASSLSIEDQVLTHLVCAATEHPRIFTLDTGRLFQETYDAMERTMEKYGFRYEILAPDAGELEEMIRTHGPNLFYRSVEMRKLCCAVRKTHPLKKLLSTVP